MPSQAVREYTTGQRAEDSTDTLDGTRPRPHGAAAHVIEAHQINRGPGLEGVAGQRAQAQARTVGKEAFARQQRPNRVRQRLQSWFFGRCVLLAAHGLAYRDAHDHGHQHARQTDQHQR